MSFFFSYSIFAGLKKFLSQYPSIFIIDGEQVIVNSFEKSLKDDLSGNGGRDYIQESKDYFKHKLLQYGIGTEVPIKSLLGHRSQASPQIRHISGATRFFFSPFLTIRIKSFVIFFFRSTHQRIHRISTETSGHI